MSVIREWAAPPGVGVARSDYEEMLAELRERPGEWAEVEIPVHTAARIKVRNTRFHYTTRLIDGERRVWAMWEPNPPTAEVPDAG